jgi:tetratricopeptide (TPR) repeat protein
MLAWMASAWSRSLTARELRDRIAIEPGLVFHVGREVPSRHRNLSAAVGWSHRLLTPEERRLLERLSVFAGPFDFDTALAVAAPDRPRDTAGRQLMRLVDRSLVVADLEGGTARFRLLETTRAFASEALRRRGEHLATVAHHARWATRLAEAIGAGFHTPEAASWGQRAERALPELQAAVYRCLDTDLIDLSLRIVAGLTPLAYEWLRADISQWALRSVEAAQAAGIAVPANAHVCAALGPLHAGQFEEAHALVEGVAGAFAAIIRSDVALYQGDYERCRRHAIAAAEAAQTEGDGTLRALALMNVGLAQGYSGNVEAALATAREVRAVATAASTASAVGWADFLEGEFLAERSPERALPLLERALRRAREIRSAMTQGIALVSTTTLRARHGDPSDALTPFEEAIRHWQRWGDWTHQRVTLRNLVLLLERLGNDDAAATLLAALEGDAPAAGTDTRHVDAARANLAARLGGRFDVAAGRGHTLDRRDIFDLALGAIDRARLPATQRRAEQAAHHTS